MPAETNASRDHAVSDDVKPLKSRREADSRLLHRRSLLHNLTGRQAAALAAASAATPHLWVARGAPATLRMRRLTYAEAAAGAAAGSSGSDLQQHPSTGTSPSLCSAPSFPDEGEGKQRGSALTSPTHAAATEPSSTATATPAAAAPVLVGAHPGTVKLLKEQFERQSSDYSVSGPSRLRSSTASTAATAAAAVALGGAAAGDSRSGAEDSKPWELLSDAKACAEVIQQLLQEKQQLQQQVDSLWSQREAFRCANERISRVLLRQQQQQPAAAAALVAAAEAAGATPRKDLARRPVNVVPSGCLTARGPRGPRMNRGLEASNDAFGSSSVLTLSPVVEGGGPQSALQHPRQHQQQKRQSTGVPGIAPLNLGAVSGDTSSRPRKGLTMRSPLPAAGGMISRGLLEGLVGGPLTCRPSLASTALKTPRRRFVDGGISARGAGDRAIQRRGPEDTSPRVAVEEALVASMRSMNLLGNLGLGGNSSSRKKVKAAAAAAAAAGRWEPTPEAALLRCSSVPEKGYWHSTFLCVLKIEGTDFFLDAVLPQQQQQEQQQQQPKARRSGSSFFSTSSSHAESRGERGMNQARIIASKETAGAFEVCVRHLWPGDNWLRSVCTSMYWGLPSGIDSAALPPDQTSRQGLRDEDTQAGELGLSRLASTPSDSGREDDEISAAAGGSSSSWSAWDAVAFMYKHSIDALGAPVPGRAAGESESLYVSSRSQDLSGGPSRSNSGGSSKGEKGEKTPSTSSSSKSSSTSGSSMNADARRAEPFSVSNQLILQEGQAAEELFIVRASDRRKGLMPLFHHASRRYLHVHPTMGLVGLVPPVSEQERQLRQQQKEEQQQKKKTKKRLKAKKQQLELQQQQQQQTGASSSNSTTGGGTPSDTSPQNAGQAVTLQSFLKPCRIELIPLGDMVLQQSVQRVLSTVQEAAMQQLQQQLQQQQEQTCEDEVPAGAAAAAHSGGSSSCGSSGEEDSFDGVVASEGGEDADPSVGISTGIRRPLVPPLGIGAPAIRTVPGAAATASAADRTASGTPAAPPLVEFRLDDDGVETDVEEVGSVRRAKSNSSSKSSSSNSSSDSSSNNNNSSNSINSTSVGGGQAYDWLSSADPTRQ
ncbi:hypothetical protein ACSSS7_003046 [Eimeria intestinalis]